MRRLKKGSRKCKGKLPFKCFNCERIGHYAARCTYKEDNYKRSNDDNKRKDNYRRHDRNKRIDDQTSLKGVVFLMETYSYEEEYCDDSNDESLCLAITEKDNKYLVLYMMRRIVKNQ